MADIVSRRTKNMASIKKMTKEELVTEYWRLNDLAFKAGKENYHNSGFAAQKAKVAKEIAKRK